MSFLLFLPIIPITRYIFQLNGLSAICLYLLLSILFFIKYNNMEKRKVIPAIAITLILSVIFIYSSLLMEENPKFVFCICCALASFPGILYLLSYDERNPVALPKISKDVKIEYLSLAIFAIALMLIASTSSPIYTFNYWVDPNAYMTVGKSMLKGAVPYRDLFEHKGPLVYFIHAAASLISNQTFIGVFIFECIAAYFFLIYALKTIRLYYPNAKSYSVLPLSAAIYFASCFCRGDSVEEFSLPLLMYALYVGVKAIEKKDLPSYKEFFVIGITSACVLWMKFTIVSFYIGWIVVPIIVSVKYKKIPELLKRLGLLLCGIFISTLPYLIYFGMNGAIKDWLTVYFYDNIFLYSKVENNIYHNIIANLSYGMFGIINRFLVGAILLILGIRWCKRKNLLLINYISILLMMLIVIFSGGRLYTYYPLALGSLTIFGYLDLINAFKKCTKAKTMAVGSVLLVLFSFNILNCGALLPQDEFPQYKAKEYIESTGIKNPTLLNYGGLDAGFYTVTGIYPNVKYFYKSNLPLEEMNKKQDEYIKNGETDFVISWVKLNSPKYKLIDKYTQFEDVYYFYQRKDL